jgi:predicted RNA binding protein YcfA (HicA-like mRNA interferase family)
MVACLQRAGWVVVRQRGSHVQLRKEGNPHVITVAMHNRNMKPGTIRGTLRDADISVEEFTELLRA